MDIRMYSRIALRHAGEESASPALASAAQVSALGLHSVQPVTVVPPRNSTRTLDWSIPRRCVLRSISYRLGGMYVAAAATAVESAAAVV